jgi:hypothetical protein
MQRQNKMKRKPAAPARITLSLNERLQPKHRFEIFEEALDHALAQSKRGEVIGGGTQLSIAGEVQSCDIELELVDISDATLVAVQSALNLIGVAKGSFLRIGERQIPVLLEGMAIYLNGTDLPDTVYEQNDINDVRNTFESLLDGDGDIRSHWGGPTETALYIYGRSFETMRNCLARVIADHPLCEKARIEQIA